MHSIKSMQVTLFAVLLLVMTDLASATTAPAPAPAYQPPLPLMWKVQDRDNAVYLLGSFHLLKDGDYPLSSDIDQAFLDAERVVFEVSPAELDDPTVAGRFLAAAAYDGPRTLSEVLTPRLREELRRLMARQGGSIEQVDGYEPWFVNLSLLMGLSQSLGFSAEQGLDRHLMARAAEAGKPIGGLETLEAQLRVLDETPMDEQMVGLADFLDRPQDMPAKLDELHQAWRSGDAATLESLTRLQMLEKTPETYRTVNIERNDAWLPQLQAMLQAPGDDDVLVVVGALHLLGDDGLVEKLRAQGYQVERICSACTAVSEGADR